jgi:hypothetical protein
MSEWLPPKACPNCDITFFPATDYQDRCSTCLDKLEDRLSRLGADLFGGRAQRELKKRKKRTHPHAKYWQLPEVRPPDVVSNDGTQVWFYAKNRVRTVGRNYKKDRQT